MLSINLDVTLNAPVARIYHAWTAPDMLQRWVCPLGMLAQTVMSNSRINGKFRITLSDQMANIHTLEGRYLAMQRNERLAFTWQWLDESHFTEVDVQFIEENPLTTQLKLTHTGFPDEEDQQLHTQAWIHCLEALSLTISQAPVQ